jgi:hypothetical protein
MPYPEIAELDALLLVRSLGLLVNQACIYGMAHNVTQSAIRRVFIELERLLAQYGAIEMIIKEKEIFLNGSSAPVEPVSAKNLAERMILQNIGGLLFTAPSDMGEFIDFVSLFSLAPADLADRGGFESALKSASFASIKPVTVKFARVGAQPPPLPLSVRRARADSDKADVLDLSAALADEDVATWLLTREGRDSAHPDAHASPPPPPPAAPRPESDSRESSKRLAAFLRETANLLDSGTMSDPEMRAKLAMALERIRLVLAQTVQDSQRHISLLANCVNGDKDMIDGLEAAARRRGLDLKISRKELLERYAELNEELVQPLTVTIGVIEMLAANKAGILTESQLDLLRLAEESSQRVSHLVAYMRRISGLPASLIPDEETIKDSYQ